MLNFAQSPSHTAGKHEERNSLYVAGIQMWREDERLHSGAWMKWRFWAKKEKE